MVHSKMVNKTEIIETDKVLQGRINEEMVHLQIRMLVLQGDPEDFLGLHEIRDHHEGHLRLELHLLDHLQDHQGLHLKGFHRAMPQVDLDLVDLLLDHHQVWVFLLQG